MFSAVLKLALAASTIVGCIGQIIMSTQEIKDSSKEIKEERDKAKNQTASTEKTEET